MANMASILNFSKVGKYAITFLLGAIICAILFVSFPPLWHDSGTVDTTIVESIRAELDQANATKRELVEQVSYLRRELETRERTLTSLRSTITEGYGNNLESGDLIVEAGITADESLLLIGELRRRFDQTK